MDQAIVATCPTPDDVGVKIGEVPYDFSRKCLSVAVQDRSGTTLVTKGALAQVRDRCEVARVPGRGDVPMGAAGDAIDELAARLGGRGLRVLGVAVRCLPSTTRSVSSADECGMTLVGLLTFADPPKPGVDATIVHMAAAGVAIKMITGDNRYAAAHIAEAVGLRTERIVTGKDIDAADKDTLSSLARSVDVFAETEAAHKQLIVEALSQSGHTVGFLGDGINDALALRAADVGISVDTAVDVAKESAAVVLLEKDLDVLLAGIRRGRQSFANTLKYVFVTTSANFGNMVSMAGATLLVPFLPLLPRQILLLNFLSDIPAATIANDAVDSEQLTRPTHWDIHFVRNFMIVFGLLSSAFDYLTFAVLRLGFPHRSTLFRTGWFTVSVATELLVMLVLRTRRSFLHSRPSRALLISTAAIGALTIAVPFSFAAVDLGFERPTIGLIASLLAILIAYVTATEIAKKAFYRRVEDLQAGSVTALRNS